MSAKDIPCVKRKTRIPNYQRSGDKQPALIKYKERRQVDQRAMLMLFVSSSHRESMDKTSHPMLMGLGLAPPRLMTSEQSEPTAALSEPTATSINSVNAPFNQLLFDTATHVQSREAVAAKTTSSNAPPSVDSLRQCQSC